MIVLLAFCAFAGAGTPCTEVQAAESKELVVAAAASLREVFQGLTSIYETRHAGVKVRLNLAGSQELRVQIENGAKVDVFAAADHRHMAALERQGLVETPVVFAENEPVVIVPGDNPARLAAFTDLPKAEHVVLGGPAVPIGAYSEAILAAAAKLYGPAFRERVMGHVRSRELNVRQVLTKVALGEADAGIVYRTDAATAKERVKAIAIPGAVNVVASYPIAIATRAPNRELAAAWVALVRGEEGQSVLRAAGFKVAPAPSRERAK